MKWNLEELTEDAIAEYLRPMLSQYMVVYKAGETTEPQYPCAIVFAGDSNAVSEPAEWHDARAVTVIVSVFSENAPVLDDSGQTQKTARDRNADARSEVMNALAVSDLVTHLNAQGIDGIAFDMAQVTSTARSVDSQVRVTSINVELIVEPVTGSA